MQKLILFIAFYTAFIAIAKGQEKSYLRPRQFSVTILYDKAVKTDTLILTIVHAYGPSEYDYKYESVINADNKFIFDISTMKNCGYFRIYKRRSIIYNNTPSKVDEITPTFFWEAGDDLQLLIFKKVPVYSYDMTAYGNYHYRFSGKSSEKYLAKNNIDSTLLNTNTSEKPFFSNAFEYNDLYEQPKKAAILELEKHKAKMSSTAYNVLKSDILFSNSYTNYTVAKETFNRLASDGDSGVVNKFRTAYNNSLLNKNEFFKIPENDLAKSINFIFHTLRKLRISYYVNNRDENADLIYQAIKNQHKGELRDVLMVSYFLNYRNSSNINKLYEDASATVKNSFLAESLKRIGLRMPGMKAFNFTFLDIAGKNIWLSDFRDKTVFIDFWYTGCGNCAVYYSKTLSKVEKYFEHDSSVVFVSVSVDISKEHWLNGLRRGIYTSSNSINLYTSGKGANDPFLEYYSIREFPTAILIDKNMKIAIYNTGDLYSVKSLIEAIRSVK